MKRADPFGTFYFGAILVLIGGIALASPAALIGAVAVLSGVMMFCTGLILRALDRRYPD